jgi:hypothetical protein
MLHELHIAGQNKTPATLFTWHHKISAFDMGLMCNEDSPPRARIEFFPSDIQAPGKRQGTQKLFNYRGFAVFLSITPAEFSSLD